MVLADDVTGNGYTDLIVSTNQGHVICVTTTIRHEPRNEWYMPVLFLLGGAHWNAY